MIYVLDTNIIRTLLNFFPKKGKRFEEVWDTIDAKIASGEFISVDECYNELERQFSDKTEQYNWFHGHKEMFKNPDNQNNPYRFNGVLYSVFSKKDYTDIAIFVEGLMENRVKPDFGEDPMPYFEKLIDAEKANLSR